MPTMQKEGLTLFTDRGGVRPLPVVALGDIGSCQLVPVPTQEQGLHPVLGLRRHHQAVLRPVGQLPAPR